MPPATSNSGLRLWSGIAAGAVSALAFAALHQLLISNIWEMVIVMVVAGAVSGLCLTWAYVRFVPLPTVVSWIRYTATYLGLFALIPPISVLMFDPVITVVEATESDGPLTDLLVEAMPLTIISVAAIAVIVSLLFGSLRRDLGPSLVASVVLMVFLGLNLTIVGLVEFSASDMGVIVGFMGLVAFLGAVFTAAFVVFEWSALRQDPIEP